MKNTTESFTPTTDHRSLGAPLGELWVQYAGDVRRLCCARAGRDLADEAVSRVSLLAYLHYLRDGRTPEHPRAWLLTIARNVCHDLHREQQRSAVETVDDQTLERLSGAQAFAMDHGNPERRLLRRERLLETRAAVENLPPRLREVLQLAVREYDSRASAAFLGVSRESVRKRIQLARGRLRRTMTGRGVTVSRARS